MPTYLAPGVYVEEKSSGIKPIEGVSTSVAAFIGVAEKGPVNKPTFVSNFGEFVKIFGGPLKIVKTVQEHYLYYAVRQFFTEGGTKCYVVRIVHYSDVNDAETITAICAGKDFDGVKLDGTSVSGALKVSAINEGKWGESLEVQVENASKFSLLLAEDITAGASVTKISLAANTDVQIGSLLWIVEEVTGVVKSVDTQAKTITFQSGFTTGTDDFTGQITNGINVFSPDFRLITTTHLANPVSVTAGTAPTGIILSDVKNVDGETLKNGDVINFVVKEALVIVKKLSSKTLPSEEKAIVIEFDSQDFTNKAFDKGHSRVYARDFTIKVKEGDTLLETHEHLSLVDNNKVDHVNERLSLESGNSFYIVAEDQISDDALFVKNQVFTALSGGNDDLTNLANGDYVGSELLKTGLYALDVVKDASILVIPNSNENVTNQAITYCDRRKDLFLIIDHPSSTSTSISDYRDKFSSQYAAIYYPWIKISDPFTGRPIIVPPSGAIAGTYANTDVKRGVHKAPAGIGDGYLNSSVGIDKIISKGENDILYQKEINVIRKFPEGIVVWGTRTISPDSEWKYINVRRLFIFLEQSIERGMQWVVFEPNSPTLWKNIKKNVSAFLRIQWLEGKLVGDTQDQAFYVKCDEETNPPEVVNIGQVITEIGVAPSKPAEFVVFRIKQFTGGSASA